MSSHKKRRELNRATAEHTHARIRAELAQGIVNFENLMEHAMGVRIKELERECDALQADNARLREALEYCVTQVGELATVPGIASALSSTPEQSIANVLDQLKAQINKLRESTELLLIARQIGHYRDEWDMLKEALAATPEQSLAAYRNKVIEECAAKCKDKHVNGNWMYDYREECEAAILDMKEQP